MQEIVDITKNIFGDYVGYAVEAGAFDGVFESTTVGLEPLGWKVLLVEPIPSAFSNLILNRNSTYCYEYALGGSSQDGVDFAVFDSYDGASMSSLVADPTIQKHFNSENKIPSSNIKVNVRTLDSLLEMAEFPRLDILSLDVEGYEMEALKGFTLSKWMPKLVIVENIFQSQELRDHFVGYELTNRLIFNDILVRID